jgi:hypothetical protein
MTRARKSVRRLLTVIFFYSKDVGVMFLSKRLFTINPHDATSQKTAFFIAIAVKISDPTLSTWRSFWDAFVEDVWFESRQEHWSPWSFLFQHVTYRTPYRQDPYVPRRRYEVPPGTYFGRVLLQSLQDTETLPEVCRGGPGHYIKQTTIASFQIFSSSPAILPMNILGGGVHPVPFSLLGLYCSGRQWQQGFIFSCYSLATYYRFLWS